VIVDTSALFAFVNDREPSHRAAVDAINACLEPLTVSPFALAELDYMVLSRLGFNAETTVLDEMLSGAWDIAQVSADQLRRAMGVVKRYSDERIGLTDAVNVVLAEDTHTKTIATLDRRHFAVLRMTDGSVLNIVP